VSSSKGLQKAIFETRIQINLFCPLHCPTPVHMKCHIFQTFENAFLRSIMRPVVYKIGTELSFLRQLNRTKAHFIRLHSVHGCHFFTRIRNLPLTVKIWWYLFVCRYIIYRPGCRLIEKIFDSFVYFL
jgi:hypothetical protein